MEMAPIYHWIYNCLSLDSMCGGLSERPTTGSRVIKPTHFYPHMLQNYLNNGTIDREKDAVFDIFQQTNGFPGLSHLDVVIVGIRDSENIYGIKEE